MLISTSLALFGVGATIPTAVTLVKTKIKTKRSPASKKLFEALTDPQAPAANLQPDKPLPDKKALSGPKSVWAGLINTQKRLAKTSGTLALVIVGQTFFPVLLPAGILATGYAAHSILKDSATVLFKERALKVDVLDATVITLSLTFGQFAVSAFMVWVLDIADLLLERTKNRSEALITDIFQYQSRYVNCLIDGVEIVTAVDDLNTDDVIVIYTSEQVPVDGMIIEGHAIIDQQALTGESIPVEKQVGEQVLAMTILVAGKIHVQVQQVGKDTTAAKIVQIIQEAAEFKVELQSTGEKIADKMVVPTLSLGALGYFLRGGGSMLAIINADYGTGIRVAAPIALLRALGETARQGVLVKDSKVFEILKDINVVIFDKTGTLTHDVPEVVNIVSLLEGYPPHTILHYTATAEQKFDHPIAKAIVQYASLQGLTLSPYDESKYHLGLGIEVQIQDDVVKIGSMRYIEQEEIYLSELVLAELDAIKSRGNTAIITAINDNIGGIIELQSKVRQEAHSIIAYLHQRGITDVLLVSGDHEAPTQKLAHELGVDHYFAGVLPHEKADYVQQFQEQGKKVMMVGDGINDSGALSRADIAVSLQGASNIAVDVADVVFMNSHLEKFIYLFDVSDRLHANVQRSFYMITIPNTICIAGGLLSVFGLTSSLILNNGFNIIAALNGASFGNRKELE